MRTTTHKRGMTLVEILVVIGIIGLLAAIVFAAMGPARAKGREGACLSNMHQWGTAIAMYISDYDGIEPSVGNRLTHAQMGLPPFNAIPFMAAYKLDRRIERCPNDHRTPYPQLPFVANISYELPAFADDTLFPHATADASSKMGIRFPLVGCDQHNGDVHFLAQPAWAKKRVLVLRYDQHIESEVIAAQQTFSLLW